MTDRPAASDSLLTDADVMYLLDQIHCRPTGLNPIDPARAPEEIAAWLRLADLLRLMTPRDHLR